MKCTSDDSAPDVVSATCSLVAILYTEDMQDGLVVEGTLTIQNPFRESKLSRCFLPSMDSGKAR